MTTEQTEVRQADIDALCELYQTFEEDSAILNAKNDGVITFTEYVTLCQYVYRKYIIYSKAG